MSKHGQDFNENLTYKDGFEDGRKYEREKIEHSEVEGLVKRLRMKADAISMGERIAWGSETALMYEAAEALTTHGAKEREAFEMEVLAAPPDIIKQQQEVAKARLLEWHKEYYYEGDNGGHDELVDTIIAETIANIGRELEARCEGERMKTHRETCTLFRVPMEVASCACPAIAHGDNQATDRTLTIIRSITGISHTR